MRTTIEMKPEHRAALLRLAALRGEKGFSGLVAEAITVWLARSAPETDLRQRALALRGSLSGGAATGLRRSTARLRREWR